MAKATAHGGCLCGGVRFEIFGPLRGVVACHCSQCRKTSGHFMAATQALSADLLLVESTTLRWHRSSDIAERGFCARCGGNLFWRRLDPSYERTSIIAGSLEPPTGLKIIRHIFVADKSDYYDIQDSVLQSPQRPA